MHDAVAGLDHVNVLEGLLGPVNEMETVVVAAVFDGAVLGESILIVAAILDRQRVIDDQLGRHHRIDLGGVSPHVGDSISQTRQVNQSGLSEYVMTNHARWIPGKIHVLLTFDNLPQ